MSKQVEQLDQVVIRIAGDSGDGMQLTGDRFTQETAIFGNDLSTLPNFPAEIRAPQGTLAGVSSFQLHFADHDILTPGDRPDVLVAMNPAALKANIGDVPKGATLIVDTHDFTTRALARVGWASEPARGRHARGLHRPRARPHPADPGRARRAPNFPARTPAGRRTCSRWGCCPGCIRARPRGRSTSSGRSSRTSPRSPRPTSPRSRRGGTSARRPRRSRSPTR